MNICPLAIKNTESSISLSNDFFRLLGTMTKILDEVEKQFATRLSPMLEEFPTQHTVCFECKRQATEKLENDLAESITLVSQKILDYISTVLRYGIKQESIGQTQLNLCNSVHQKKIDFENDEPSVTETKAATTCVGYFNQILPPISENLVGALPWLGRRFNESREEKIFSDLGPCSFVDFKMFSFLIF